MPLHPAPNSSVINPLPSKTVVNAAKLLIAAWTSLSLAVTFQIGLMLDTKPAEYKYGLTTEHSRQWLTEASHGDCDKFMLRRVHLLPSMHSMPSAPVPLPPWQDISQVTAAELKLCPLPCDLLSDEHLALIPESEGTI